ncbi:MAG: NAD(P)/FAD-dependent oxidoreductase [Chloroflexi bacterium]|nr:NAD(P)/FAD-dependent oxidoreductase [Chloroflexota bacterium]
MKVGIVGGGMMGVSLGYFLSQQGAEVEIFEAASHLGGLADSVVLSDGTSVDRFYHTILSSDSHLRELCAELGIADKLRFRETRMGFFYRGQIHSMNNIVEFLRFPPLNWIDRFRLGLTVLYAQLVRDWHRLEGVSVEEWLLRLSGRRTFENIWRPMLKAKFDGGFERTPATYIWSRLVRMKSTRSGASQKEEAGHVIGGYATLIDAMVDRINAAGGSIHLCSPVQEILIEQGRARGLRSSHDEHVFDAVVAALQAPVFRRMIPCAGEDYRDAIDSTEYLGVICPLMVLDRPLTGFWTLNITDDQIPFTGVIETTTYIDPGFVGGHHLIYLPKYTAPGSAWQQMSDEQITKTWLQNLQAMFPGFDQEWIHDFTVHRERHVEPLHWLNSSSLIPEFITPVDNLYLATTAQIYPALTNGESVTRHARQLAEIILRGRPGAANLSPDVVVSESVVDTARI